MLFLTEKNIAFDDSDVNRNNVITKCRYYEMTTKCQTLLVP